jgi:hypothetical protein
MAISFEHGPEKHALGLDPGVGTGFFRIDQAQSKGSAFVIAEGSLCYLQIVP